jgi:hypothetical protein
MYTPEITRFVDDVAADEFRLETADIRELQSQMNVNTVDGEDSWFDTDPEYRSDIQIIDSEEFFDRFVQ